MSAQSEAIKTLLAADATLTAILTGGVYEYTLVGKDVVTPQSLPTTAYDASGYLKPIALVKARSEFPFGGGYDHANKYNTVRDVVEVYLLRDGDATTVDLKGAADRVENLLFGVFVGGGWAGIINRIDDEREPLLNNALYIRVDVGIVRGKYR